MGIVCSHVSDDFTRINIQTLLHRCVLCQSAHTCNASSDSNAGILSNLIVNGLHLTCLDITRSAVHDNSCRVIKIYPSYLPVVFTQYGLINRRLAVQLLACKLSTLIMTTP